MNSITRIILSLFCIIAICFSTLNPVFAIGFTAGDLFICSSGTDEVRIYDSETLDFKDAFTHDLFQIYGNIFFKARYGPNGAAFNDNGNLVVSAYTHFVEFSSPGIEFARYEKTINESNENIIFDSLGNMYTTTSTGGSNYLNQYRASDYAFVQSIELPTGAGELTGITFSDDGRLFVASQSDGKIHVLQANNDFSSFSYSYSIQSQGTRRMEGIQFNHNGELVVAEGDISRYNPDTGELLGSFDLEPDTNALPVSLTTDNFGRIFVADFEDGLGSKSADIIRFASDGSSSVSFNDPGLFGPFGLVIAGTKLPGGPVPEPATIFLSGTGLIGLVCLRRKFKK